MKKNLKAILMACLMTCTAAAFTACASNDNSGNGDGGNDNPPADDYGTVCIEDMKVYINSNKNATFAEIEPVFTKPDKKEDLTYTFDAKSLDITNGIVKPKKREDKTLTVTAKSEHFETKFKVEVEYINYNADDVSSLYEYKDVFGNDLSGKVNSRVTHCRAITENTTLFIGDSFMDSDFIGKYWTTYSENKDVLNAGISSSTSYHWERAFYDIIGDPDGGATAPKNIAIHVGTNNFYDFKDTVEDTEESLMRLFMYMHDSYPTTNIYWFNITQRTDSKYAEQVKQTNAYIANRAEELDFLTVVDTSSKVTSAMLRDGVHPTDDNYHVFTDALVAAGCEIAEKA